MNHSIRRHSVVLAATQSQPGPARAGTLRRTAALGLALLLAGTALGAPSALAAPIQPDEGHEISRDMIDRLLWDEGRLPIAGPAAEAVGETPADAFAAEPELDGLYMPGAQNGIGSLL